MGHVFAIQYNTGTHHRYNTRVLVVLGVPGWTKYMTALKVRS